MKLATRFAQADDKPAMWALYESALKPHIEIIWGWDTAWQEADFDKAFQAAASYVLEVDGAFAGYFQLDFGPEEHYLRMLLLRHDMRSRGLGAGLLTAVLEICRRSGRGLGLRAFRTNLDALRFYQREGWVQVADQGDFKFLRHASCLADQAPRRLTPVLASEFELQLRGGT